MPLTNAGAVGIAAAIVAYVTTPYLGVGEGSTAFSAGQTDLVGPQKLRKTMDGGYPSRNSGTITFRSTFGTSDANWAWAEWGIFDAPSAGTMYGRKVESLGTKTIAQTWQLTTTITMAAA